MNSHRIPVYLTEKMLLLEKYNVYEQWDIVDL